ncbi:IS3 family transposase [Lysinibacillus macroides]|nr:IS3 family transposase [Lysinibacillus macroides]
MVEKAEKDYINYYNDIRIQMKIPNQLPVQYRSLVA